MSQDAKYFQQIIFLINPPPPQKEKFLVWEIKLPKIRAKLTHLFLISYFYLSFLTSEEIKISAMSV